MSLEQVKKKMAFIGGEFLDNKALPVDGVQVTIKKMQTQTVKNMRTFKDEEKKVLYFEELEHGMILSAKKQRRKLIEMVKVSSQELIGKKITIYQDPTVKAHGELTGGIRIK